MAHNNNPSDLNRSLRDTGEESSPSPPRQSQRRRLTGSQWTGGDNQALQYLSGVAAQGFTDGWNDRGPALPRETDDAQHYPTAGPGLQPLDEGVNLYSPSGHLDSRLGQAPLTDYGGYVPDPSSLAPDPGRTRDFSSTDSLARYTGQQSLWSYPIAGPSGGGENFDDTPLPENIGPPLERTSHTDYRGYVSDPYGLADDSYRTGGVPSLGSTEFGAPQSFDTDAARSVGPSLSQTESLYSNELNPDATHLSDFGSSQGRKRKRTGEGLSTRHGDPSAFSSWDLLDNASQNTRSVSSRTTNLTTWSLQERLGDVALQDSLHGPQTQQHNLDSEIKRLALELKGQVSSIEGWSWSSSEQRKSLLQGLSPEQKKPLLERIDALDPKMTQWVNHCEMKKRTLNNALSRDRGKLRELAQQCQQAEDEKQEAESARNLLASRPMSYYVGFEDQIQEYDEEITRLDTNVGNANNQYNKKKQELDPLIKSNDEEKRRYNNEATMGKSFLKYMKTIKENLQVSPLSAQGDREGYRQGPFPSDAHQQAEPQQQQRPGRKKRGMDVSVDLPKREIKPKLEPNEDDEQKPILPKLEPDEYGPVDPSKPQILPKPDPGGDGPAEQHQEIELSAEERDLVRRRADGWLDVAAQNMVDNRSIKKLKDALGDYKFTKEECSQLREKCKNLINGLKLESGSLEESAKYDGVYSSLKNAIHREAEVNTSGFKPVLDRSQKN